MRLILLRHGQDRFVEVICVGKEDRAMDPGDHKTGDKLRLGRRFASTYALFSRSYAILCTGVLEAETISRSSEMAMPITTPASTPTKNTVRAWW